MSTRVWSKGSFSELLPLPPRHKLSRYSWLFDIVRLEGSVTGRILGPVLTVTLFATLVAVGSLRFHYNLKLTNNVVPLLSVVVGLILVFRNGTSYDRWYEGSKDWETMISHCRNSARQIWINVIPSKATPSNITPQVLRQQKIRALNLVSAYLYAVKHHLRNEPGIHHLDLGGLLPEDGQFAEWYYDSRRTTPGASRIGYVIPRTESPPRSSADRAEASENGQRRPLLNNSVNVGPSVSGGALLSLPLIIAHELTRIVFKFKKDGCLDLVGPAGANTINTLIQGMVAQLAKMERVSNTPIPVSYGIHLKQCVTLYLFALPFTLVGDLGWAMVPVVTVVSFTLMGIEGIADEIEMPFGEDYHDLPLDRLCDEVRAEIEYVVDRLPEGYDDEEEEF